LAAGVGRGLVDGLHRIKDVYGQGGIHRPRNACVWHALIEG
jgi:hypothetical protein